MKYHARHAAPRDRRRSHTLAGALALGVALSLVATPAYAGDIKPRRGEGAISMVTRECGSAKGWQAIASAAGIRSSNGWLVLYGRTYSISCKPTTRSNASSSRSSAKWVHPVPGARTTSCYGARRSGYSHGGVDLAIGSGTRIRAVAAGRVVVNRWNSGAGWYVAVDHGTYQSVYMHMIRRSPLGVGTRVDAGQRIGNVGSTGNSTGPHLHLEIHKGLWNRINPSSFMRARGVNVGC